MPSRKNSREDRERRRDDAKDRAANRAGRTAMEQFEMLDRAPGYARREMRRLSDKVKISRSAPNHFYNDSLGDPATCTKDHNHPPVSHLPDPPHVSG